MDLPFDDADRPRLLRPVGPPPSPSGRRGQLTLLAIHRHLRSELAAVVDAVAAAARGDADPAAAREVVHDTAMVRNSRVSGAFCAQYCQFVSMHHAIEDRYMFPSIGAADPDVAPVLERLQAEHAAIHGVLVRIDELLVAMLTDGTGAAAVTAAVRQLQEALLSHLDYEEEQLLEPIGRLALLV